MFAINDSKMFYDMADGQAIVINFQTGMYYGMSSLGSAAADALIGGASVSGVEKGLKALPGCPEDITASLKAFIGELLEKEIFVETQGDGESSPVPFGQEALADGFLLEVNEYAEAQDLILADPIHDVDVDMGWPIMKENM